MRDGWGSGLSHRFATVGPDRTGRVTGGRPPDGEEIDEESTAGDRRADPGRRDRVGRLRPYQRRDAGRRTGDHQFKGLLDLTKAEPAAAKATGAQSAKAKAVPFTAVTDTEGRLTQMTIDMTGISPEAGTVKTNYTDFGTPVSVTAPPAAEVQELPSSMKGLFGGN